MMIHEYFGVDEDILSDFFAKYDDKDVPVEIVVKNVFMEGIKQLVSQC